MLFVKADGSPDWLQLWKGQMQFWNLFCCTPWPFTVTEYFRISAVPCSFSSQVRISSPLSRRWNLPYFCLLDSTSHLKQAVQCTVKWGIWCWLVLQTLSLDQMPYQIHLQKSHMSHLELSIFFYRNSCWMNSDDKLNRFPLNFFFLIWVISSNSYRNNTKYKHVLNGEKLLLSWKRIFSEMWKVTERNLKDTLLCSCKQ